VCACSCTCGTLPPNWKPFSIFVSVCVCVCIQTRPTEGDARHIPTLSWPLSPQRYPQPSPGVSPPHWTGPRRQRRCGLCVCVWLGVCVCVRVGGWKYDHRQSTRQGQSCVCMCMCMYEHIYRCTIIHLPISQLTPLTPPPL
jgi:hypothetical protein